MTESKQKSFTFAFSLVQATYWMTACAVLSYAVIYLQALSFSNFSIGIITAAGKVIGALIGPVLATYLDRHPKYPTARMNYPLLFAQIALFTLLLLFGRNSFLTGFIFALMVGLFVSTNSVVLRFCGDCVIGGYSLNYGVARGIGSLAFIIPSVFLGLIFKRIPATYLPVFGIFLMIIQIIVNFYAGNFFKGQRSVSLHDADSGDSLLHFLKAEPVFTRLLIGICLIFYGYYVYATFVINIVKNVGGDTAGMGLLTGFGAAMEIPTMFLLSRLRKKWKVSSLLLVSVIAFSVKALATALVTSMPGLYVAMSLQCIGYALYAAAIVEYVNAVIPKRNLAKAQSLVYTTEMIGGVISGLISGRLFDVTSVKNTLLVGFIVSVVGTILCIFGIKKAK